VIANAPDIFPFVSNAVGKLFGRNRIPGLFEWAGIQAIPRHNAKIGT
jgi:hypothetical protein